MRAGAASRQLLAKLFVLRMKKFGSGQAVPISAERQSLPKPAGSAVHNDWDPSTHITLTLPPSTTLTV